MEMEPALNRASKRELAMGRNHNHRRPASGLTLAPPIYPLPCERNVFVTNHWVDTKFQKDGPLADLHKKLYESAAKDISRSQPQGYTKDTCLVCMWGFGIRQGAEVSSAQDHVGRD